MEKFVHLHTHSHYSLLDGLPKIPALVARAKELGMDAVAVTDHGNLYAAVEFYKAAVKAKIKPIFGVEAYIAPGSHKEKSANGGEKYYHLTLIAENEAGWKNLIQLVTKSHLDGFYYRPRMDKDLLRAHHEGLIALSGCYSGETTKAILSERKEEAERIVREYQDIFGKENFFIEIGHHPNFDAANFTRVRTALIELSRTTGAPLVATQDIHYLLKEDAEYHDVLLAVQTGNKVSDPDRLSLKVDDFSMLSPAEMAAFFTDVPEAIRNTVLIGERCNTKLDLGKILLPTFPLPPGEASSDKYLRKILDERISRRYKASTPEVMARLEMELGVIERMGFSDYFLIVQDFINWAKERGIVVGPGRGSAAGSIVSYILGITDLDPIKYELIFERFLNPERIQMPDIDIDITDVRRDEVLGYLREKYGEDHVAHIITFGTMAARAAIRDVGRALGLSYSFCDQLAKLIPFNTKLEEALQNVNELRTFYQTNEDAKRLLDAATHLEGVARHASVHACGIVITKEALTNYLPLQRAPQDANVIITQFEMHAVEDLGLLKMDLLGLRNLTTIENTIRLIEEETGTRIDISNIPLDDKKVFDLLQKGQTTGVFQLESGGMTRYLKDLKPTEFEDLIAMVALYRPGPLEAGMVPRYIARKNGKEEVTYLHPKLEPILKNTYGIGVYQEQMMKIASDLAGFSLAEADTLRKAIGKKIKSLLDEQEVKLMSGMTKNNIPERTARAIWELFPSFARYGFNRSHAACYAMIAYETAYLKAHYPVLFMTALLNAEAGDIERTAFLISECKKMGIEVLAPDVNRSESAFTPEDGNIRFGLSAVKNVGVGVVSGIIREREAGGPFLDLSAFLRRVKHKDLNKKSLESLVKGGALDSLQVERNQILSNIDDILKYTSAARREETNGQSGLFGAAEFRSSGLQLKDAPPATPTERLQWEKELLGLYVTDHPLNRAREKINGAKPTLIKDMLAERSGSKMYRIAGMITTVKPIVTKTGKPMAFVKMEDESGSIEIVMFSESYAAHKECLREGAIVALVGRLNSRNGELAVVCENMKEL